MGDASSAGCYDSGVKMRVENCPRAHVSKESAVLAAHPTGEEGQGGWLDASACVRGRTSTRLRGEPMSEKERRKVQNIPAVNPRYRGATLVDMARVLTRPQDPRARETLTRLQADEGRSVTKVAEEV